MGVSVAGTSGRHLVIGMTVAAYTDEETPHGTACWCRLDSPHFWFLGEM